MAAQKRAEEIVARIRAEKAAAAAAAANGGEAAAASPASPRTPSRTATADFAQQTPERTPQVPTPMRVQPSTTSVSTAPSAGGESSTVLINNKLAFRSMGTQSGLAVGTGVSGGLESLPESGVASPQSPSLSQPTSPARAAKAATALDQANAAIEAARQASAALEGVDAEHSTVAQSIGSAVYIPAAGGAGSGVASGPTSPMSTISIGHSGSGAGSYAGSPRPLSPNNTTNLDLRTNDSAFHVMASTLLTRFEPKLSMGGSDGSVVTTYTIGAEDRVFLEKMMPHTVRWTFIDALRYRREALQGGLDAIPIGGESTTAELTRRCCYLGFDRPEDENVLLVSLIGGTFL